ncbi:HIT family protein [Chloroflexota bacterium]
MVNRAESDEKYILDLVAEVLVEPDYRWQHRFPTLVGDVGKDGRRRPLPVDGYFPRHRLIVEYWEVQHSAPVPIMDEGLTVSGVSRGHQRRLYDQRRQQWADAQGLKLVILDYRGFDTDEGGRLRRQSVRDRQIVAEALHAAGALSELQRHRFEGEAHLGESGKVCSICKLAKEGTLLPECPIIWRDRAAVVFLDRFPTVFGSTVVAPVEHREQVTGDFSLVDYLALQRVLHGTAEAVRHALRPERVYVLSLGSEQASAHVHWHIVPCPPELPLEQQQLALLDAEQMGVLHLAAEDLKELSSRMRAHLPKWMRERQG